jgi:hypothetical protein
VQGVCRGALAIGESFSPEGEKVAARPDEGKTPSGQQERSVQQFPGGGGADVRVHSAGRSSSET